MKMEFDKSEQKAFEGHNYVYVLLHLRNLFLKQAKVLNTNKIYIRNFLRINSTELSTTRWKIDIVFKVLYDFENQMVNWRCNFHSRISVSFPCQQN